MPREGSLRATDVRLQDKAVVCDAERPHPVVVVAVQVVPRLGPEAISDVLHDVHDDLSTDHPAAVVFAHVSSSLSSDALLPQVRSLGTSPLPLHQGHLVPPLRKGLMHSDTRCEHEKSKELHEVNAGGDVAVRKRYHLFRLGHLHRGSVSEHAVLLHGLVQAVLRDLARISLIELPENLLQLRSTRPHDVQVRLEPYGLLVAAKNISLVLDRSAQDVAHELDVELSVVLRVDASAHDPVDVDAYRRFVLVLDLSHNHLGQVELNVGAFENAQGGALDLALEIEDGVATGELDSRAGVSRVFSASYLRQINRRGRRRNTRLRKSRDVARPLRLLPRRLIHGRSVRGRVRT
mmetsp:Transcript_26370/g.49919  ORF Transcript_26370/g.49919 Transcript_26370/m.49919 type:complete len:349 (-) Transcript_26370:200-1246(-)